DEVLGDVAAVGGFEERRQCQAGSEEAEQRDCQLQRGTAAEEAEEESANGGSAEGGRHIASEAGAGASRLGIGRGLRQRGGLGRRGRGHATFSSGLTFALIGTSGEGSGARQASGCVGAARRNHAGSEAYRREQRSQIAPENSRATAAGEGEFTLPTRLQRQ